MLTWLLILLVVVMGSCGDVLCAKGMANGGELKDFGLSGIRRIIRSILVRRLVILGFVCDAISFFALLALLSIAPLSVAVPATALSFIIDALGARFILHEELHWRRWVGVLCVAAGVLLTVNSGGKRASTRPSVPTPAAVQADQH